MKRKFIVNPSSGGRSSVLPRLRLRYPEADCVVTQNRADAVTQTRLALQSGVEQVVAVGGDGTINAVANGFFHDGKPINPDACLAVAPFGTGSDYFRTIALGKKVDWTSIMEKPRILPVDLGEIRFRATPEKSVFFVNVASVGMSAAVVQKKETLPSLVPSALRYFLPTLGLLFTYRATKLRVTIDGENLEKQVLALFLAKGEYLGGGMRFAGGHGLDNGKLTVTLVENLTLFEGLIRLPRIYTGKFEGDAKFLRRSASNIRICSDQPLPVEFDGEILGATDIDVSVRPAALRLCFPHSR